MKDLSTKPELTIDDPMLEMVYHRAVQARRCNKQVRLWYSPRAFGFCILTPDHLGECFHPRSHKPAEIEKVSNIPCECRNCREKRMHGGKQEAQSSTREIPKNAEAQGQNLSDKT